MRELAFMDGVHNLASFKAVLATRVYWADAWAVEEMQVALKLKCAILRNGTVSIFSSMSPFLRVCRYVCLYVSMS